MAPVSLFALAFTAASTVSALPHWGPSGTLGGSIGNWNFGASWNGRWGRDATPTLPLNEVDNSGPSPLPTPTTAVDFVLLGVGFQNYTCGAAGAYVQNVPSVGAIADLFDITENVNSNTKDSITKGALQAFEACLKKTRCSPSPDNGYCNTCLNMAPPWARQKLVGEHFFDQVNGAQTPNFDIYGKGDFLSAKKAGSVAAPASAYDGQNGLGAVPWLYLVDNGSGRTHGVSSVYRVETAGGVAPSSCSAGSTLQVPYAAEYWFYG